MGLSLQEVYDMTWAEFLIRSFALKRILDREERLFREVAYQGYRMNFLFGKERPKRKNVFWPISSDKRRLSKEHVDGFMDRMREYVKNRKKDG